MVEHYVSWFIDQVIESGECRHGRRSSASRPSSPSTGWGSTSRTGAGTPRRTTRALAAMPGSPSSTSMPSRSTSPTSTSRPGRSSRARRENPQDDIISYLVQQEVDDRPVDRRRGVLDGRPAARRRRRHDRVAGQQHRGLAVPEPRRAPAAHRRPVVAGQGDRGVPALLLPHPGAGPDGRRGHRVPRLPDEDRRPGAARVVSANRDAQQFDDPDELDITRWPNRHTAFGIGVHRCAGSHLGRAMAKELLGQILDADAATTSSTSTRSSRTRTRAPTPATSGSRRPSRPGLGG